MQLVVTTKAKEQCHTLSTVRNTLQRPNIILHGSTSHYLLKDIEKQNMSTVQLCLTI